MWLMLQQDAPDDYVIATGETHSVRELCEVAFSLVGLDWERYVRVDAKYLRPRSRSSAAMRRRRRRHSVGGPALPSVTSCG